MEVKRWQGGRPPSREQLEELIRNESPGGSTWSNGPGFQYAAHSHAYTKILYVIEGSIRFDVPELSEHVTLRPGDRMELPAGQVHSAKVGPQGVECLEAHRPAREDRDQAEGS